MKTNEILNHIGWMAEGHPNVSWGLEGYDPDKRVFGCRAGPECDLENLFHEFSHAIVCVLDGQVERLECRSYGLSLPYREVLGTTVVQPTTGQITLLESRVFGIQRLLMETVGLEIRPHYFQYCAEVCDFLPDYFKYTPSSLRRRKGFSFDEARRRRVSSLIARCYIEASEDVDRIKNAWFRVCSFNALDNLPGASYN